MKQSKQKEKDRINNLDDNRIYIVDDFFGLPIRMTGKQIKTLNNHPNETTQTNK